MIADQSLMSCARLERELAGRFPSLDGCAGRWVATIESFELYIAAEEALDHVRLMIPVARADHADHELMLVLLSANFDRAFDARYALHRGLVWCLSIGTLSGLTVARLDQAIRAVVTLAANTGSTFASGEARFHGFARSEGGAP